MSEYFEQGGILYRQYTDGRIGYFRVGPVSKPMLRLGAHHHAWASEPRADFPMRLERNRDGIYYWAAARDGEYHWWLTVKSTVGSKTAKTAPEGSGTILDAIRT
jgi:hypothetical protein